MEALPGLWSLSPIAALIGLLVLGVYWLVKGEFIPRKTHEREVQIYKDLIVNKDTTISKQTDQIGQLLIVVDTVQGVLRYAGSDDDTPPMRGA